MSYKEQLNQTSDDLQNYPDSRAEEISNDIREVLSDGSAFGELLAIGISEIASKTIDKIGIEKLAEKGIDGFKSIVEEATVNALNEPEFSRELGQAMMKREVDRELDDFHKDDNHLDDREMEP